MAGQAETAPVQPDYKRPTAFIGLVAGSLVASLALSELAQEPGDCLARSETVGFDINVLECSNDLFDTEF